MRRLALALVAAALASPVVALPATAASSALDQGDLLPQRMGDGVAMSLTTVSNTHVITPADPTTASHPEGRRDLRRIDGTLVAADITPPGRTLALSDRFVTSVTPARVSPPAPMSADWLSLVDGSPEHRLTAPAGWDGLRPLDAGLLLRRDVDVSTHQLAVMRFDGSVAPVAGTGTGQFLGMWVAPEQDVVLLKQVDRLYVVDVETATATVVTSGFTLHAVLGATATRIWWTSIDHLGTTLRWADRDDVASQGSVRVDTTNADLMLLGDGVALKPYHPVDDVYGYRSVDPTTGAATALPFSQVLPPVQLAGGRAAAILRDRPSGRVVTFGAGGGDLREEWVLPQTPAEPTGLVVNDEAVTAQWRGWQLASLTPGASTWSVLPDSQQSRSLRAASGDVLVTTGYTGWDLTAVATWPGGSRVLAGDENATNSVVLGRTGRLYGVAGPSSTEVREVRTGTRVGTVPLGTRYAIDGTWLWTLSASGLVTGTDLVSGSTTSVATGSTCSSTFSVVGRWAALGCYDDLRGILVVDLAGVVDSWTVRAGTQCQSGWPCTRPHVLGDGFLAWPEPPTPPGDLPSLVRVVDLSGSREVRSYGPGSAPAVGLDRSDGLTYLAPRGVRVAQLDWLGTAPTPRTDATAPQLGAVTGSPAAGQVASMSVGWSATDPGSAIEPASGVASYDVRYQRSPSTGAAFGDWVTPAGWSATTSTSVTLDVPVGSTTCVQVRARDVAGNVSAWTASRCYQRLAPGFTALVAPGDLTGDARADLLARDAAGALWLYQGTGTGSFGKARKIGTGWGSFTALVGPGDLTGDTKPDVLARATNGSLWLYPGTGKGTVGAGRQIGTGWGSFTALVGPGDLTGDTKPDVLARATNGSLWLYPGTGKGTVGAGRQIGTGWAGFTALVGPGDLTGDTKPDVLARATNGSLWLYPGTGKGTVGAGRQIGTGWAGFTALVGPGDLTGDTKPDVLARATNGSLWLYPGTGKGTVGAGRQIGTGW